MPQDTTALTPQEVADILKIAKNTVYELIKRGELNSYKVGKKIRVDMEDVEAYKNRTKKPSLVSAQSEMRKEGAFSIPTAPSHLIICGQDMVLDILGRFLEQHKQGTRALRSYVGSYAGLYALYHGEVHAATAHIWDGDTGEYNIPYVRRMLPGTPAAVFNLITRMEGFYVLKGNPKGITGWNDIGRDDLVFANREKGSGARILFDERIRLMGVSKKQIEGYYAEYPSHLAVASAVARGEADYGLGCYGVAGQFEGIEFIPLQEERYDLVLKKEDLERGVFQAIIEVIQSDEFKSEIAQMGGYGTKYTGKLMGET